MVVSGNIWPHLTLIGAQWRCSPKVLTGAIRLPCALELPFLASGSVEGRDRFLCKVPSSRCSISICRFETVIIDLSPRYVEQAMPGNSAS